MRENGHLYPFQLKQGLCLSYMRNAMVMAASRIVTADAVRERPPALTSLPTGLVVSTSQSYTSFFPWSFNILPTFSRHSLWYLFSQSICDQNK